MPIHSDPDQPPPALQMRLQNLSTDDQINFSGGSQNTASAKPEDVLRVILTARDYQGGIKEMSLVGTYSFDCRDARGRIETSGGTVDIQKQQLTPDAKKMVATSFVLIMKNFTPISACGYGRSFVENRVDISGAAWNWYGSFNHMDLLITVAN